MTKARGQRTWRMCCATLGWVLCALMSARAAAQETFFQVPTGDVPELAQGRAQFQLGAGKELDLGGTAVVGIGYGLELGVTLYNLDFAREEGKFGLADNASGSEPYAPLALFVAQKLFKLTDHWGLALGAQLGSNVAARDRLALVARAYGLAVLDLKERGRCTLGPYAATKTLLGDAQRFGGFAGCEIEIVPEAFGFEAEWDAGAHALGALAFGPRAHLGKCCALSVGAQIPNAWGSAAYRALAQLEITYPGKQE